MSLTDLQDSLPEETDSESDYADNDYSDDKDIFTENFLQDPDDESDLEEFLRVEDSEFEKVHSGKPAKEFSRLPREIQIMIVRSSEYDSLERC